MLLERISALRERILASLDALDDWLDADAIAATRNVSRKSIKNCLSLIAGDEPSPVAINGSGKSNAPRRFHSRT